MPLTIEDVIGKIENDRLYKRGRSDESKKLITALLLDGTYTVERISTLSGVPLDEILNIKRQLEQPPIAPVSAPKKKSPRKPPTKKDGE